MRDLKSFTSRKLAHTIKTNPQESRREWMFDRAGRENTNNANAQFWQQNNHPIELGRESFDIDKYLDYIHDNPIVAGFVSAAEDFLYCSAKDDTVLKGLVDIELM